MNRRVLSSLLVLCVLGGTICFSLQLTAPPEPLTADAPAADFSAGRAMGHLAFFGREPRPMGDFPARIAARDYLLDTIRALGLEPQVQDSVGVRALDRNSLIGGAVENILVRVPGTNPAGAILLIAHYDSTPGGPGAGDNGSGVVTLLELLRALQANPRLKQDVIFLFADGHEPGIIGSHAFVAQHAWLDDVDLVINLDCLREGATQGIITVGRNYLWVEAIAHSARRSSLISLPYHLFPSGDSDLVPFFGNGIPGVTIRGAMGSLVHHTPLDLPATVNPGTVQQAGEQVLALVQSLGDRPSLDGDGPNQTYFPVLGRLVHYPNSWAIPIAGVAGLALAAALWYGFSRRELTLRGLGLGFLGFVLSLGISLVVVNLAWLAIQAQHPNYAYSSYRPHLSDDYLYMVGFQLLTLAVTTASIAVARKWVAGLDLAAGLLAFWFLAALAVPIIMPASSFLTGWVLLAGSLALLWALLVRTRENANILAGLGFLGSAVLASALWLPVIRDTYYGGPLASGFLMLSTMVGLTGLWLGALAPILEWLMRPKRWMLPTAAAVAGIGFLIAGNFLVGRASPPPMVNSLGYWLDATTDEACWVGFIGGTRIDAHSTTDREAAFPKRMDQRQLAVLQDPIRRPYTELFPEAPPFSVLTSWAPRLPQAGPEMAVISDQWANGSRIVDLRLTASMRDRLYVVIPEAQLLAMTMPSNKRIDLAGENELWLRLDGMPAEGMALRFEFSSGDPVQFLLVEEKTGLPSFPGLSIGPPPGTMQSPGEFQQGVPADFTAIYRPFELTQLDST